MVNIEYKIEGDVLVLRVNLKERHGPSKSGNTTIIAQTGPNQKLTGKHEQIWFGLNVYTKEGKATAAKVA